MKYIFYTIVLFFLCIFQVSFLNTIPLFSGRIDIIFIILFSYYILRKDKFSLYLFFVAGIFIDFFSVTQIGVTSADYFIALIVFAVIGYLIPNERFGQLLSITLSSIIFTIMPFVTLNFLSLHTVTGLLYLIPWGIINGVMIFIIGGILPSLPFLKKETKIKIR